MSNEHDYNNKIRIRMNVPHTLFSTTNSDQFDKVDISTTISKEPMQVADKIFITGTLNFYFHYYCFFQIKLEFFSFIFVF